jgi:hypothetical protein
MLCVRGTYCWWKEDGSSILTFEFKVGGETAGGAAGELSGMGAGRRASEELELVE